MANLYLDRAGADQVIKSVQDQIQALTDAAIAIDSAIASELPNYWQGTAHDKAETTYIDEYKQFLTQKVPEVVQALNDFMQTCVVEITNVDNQLAGM